MHDEIAELTRQKNALARDNFGLKAQLQAAKSRLNPARGLPPAGETVASAARDQPPLAVLDLSTVQQLGFTSLDMDDFKLTPEAIALLGLTPGENAQMQDVMAELKKRNHAHALATLQTLPADKIRELSGADANLAGFFQKHAGENSVYQIAPFSENEGADLRQWFAASTTGILGGQRGGILNEKAQNSFNLWLTKGATTIAFVDGENVDSPEVKTSWLIETQEMTMSSGGGAENDIPSPFEYLFEHVKDDQISAAP